ncbi:helix-turn-helix domain protein [Kribbella flavida DSM 17836]|uniref:Helix-turn-helix domain protein n=1 Tax=Kribbella flavida (strain DSM 17836 / JCM 10339 / NBRC 14399) TaxID=479435 RepID=D2PLW7_KRIFD|nr:helix-turn-helix transcriptional regulator [Kribbella flavida]ADB32547.1 helix-turn-helix domain protein [Kribbella flavida DSM 17836]
MAGERPAVGQQRREQLRDFLRTRRARLTPRDVGLPTSGRRRTPGLRREEVATLAGVGVSWYTWLEQGRAINVSVEVLDAISRALRLTGPERAHLYVLAGVNPPPAAPAPGAEITAELRHLLDAWTAGPAMLQDRSWNLLAINDAARTVFGYDDTDYNCLVSYFTNARYRALHVHWTSLAPEIVAAFRADAAKYPGDPGFAAVIRELSAISPEFVEHWQRHDVATHTQAVKAVLHPAAGELIFDKTALVVADRPEWRLELYQPRPGSGTKERYEQLLSTPLVRPA